MPVKYTVNLDSTAARNAAAFAPVPALSKSAAYNGQWSRRITGHPGDMSVKAPKPNSIPAGPLNREAQPSYNSPDVIFPSKYFYTLDGWHLWTLVKSTNELPVPATSYKSIPQVAQNPAKIGGLKSVGWPPATPVWQTLNNTPSGS